MTTTIDTSTGNLILKPQADLELDPTGNAVISSGTDLVFNTGSFELTVEALVQVADATLRLPNLGGAITTDVAVLALAQTFLAEQTFSRAGRALTAQNNIDGDSVQVAILEGNRGIANAASVLAFPTTKPVSTWASFTETSNCTPSASGGPSPIAASPSDGGLRPE